MQPLNIFVPHCSDLLTDFRPNGDGLVANGFIRHLAKRGHQLYVAAEQVDVREPFPANVHITSFGTRKGFLGRIGFMRSMRRLYRQHSRSVRFDIIHQLNPVFTGMSLALSGVRTPLVLGPYVANWPQNPDAVAASRKSLRRLIGGARSTLASLQQRRASILLLTTPAAQDRIPHPEAVAPRIRMLPHGLDTNFFAPAPSPAHTSTTSILFLSNIVERKGIFDLLAAFAHIAAAFPATQLLIAGDGPELPRLKALAADLSCRDQIVFLGRQNREESLRLLQACTVFCQPSLGEPFGMSAAEAMSCGKPLVVTDAGGLRYIVDDESGFRVPVGDPAALAGALSTLLSDPGLRSSIGKHNRQRIVDWMSWERVVERLENIYGEVLQSRPAALHQDPS